jgi:hypothetical protein
VQRVCQTISAETGRNKTLLDDAAVVQTLNRIMIGCGTLQTASNRLMTLYSRLSALRPAVIGLFPKSRMRETGDGTYRSP